MHVTMCNYVIHTKTYFWTDRGIVFIWLFTWKINTGTLFTTTKKYFQYVNAYFDVGYARIFAIAMSDDVLNICLPCGRIEFLYVSKSRFAVSPDLLFCALQLWSLSFSKKRSRNDNNDECMLLEDMQHSQQHMTLYQEVIFLSWGGKIWRKVESLMMISLSEYIASFSSSSYGGITGLLCSSHTETFNNNFGINCFL